MNNEPTIPEGLSKHKRKELKRNFYREQQLTQARWTRFKKYGVISLIIIVILLGGYKLIQKSPEKVAFNQEVKQSSLDGKVEEFAIEGRDHISAETDVEYKTNPPTSGGHLAEAKNWGINDKEIDDKAGVHNLEHGGIWISYKNLDEESIKALEEISKNNPQSVIVSPRNANENILVIASWGKMMKLERVDKALIQKYIDTYKNQSPEKLAR